VAKHPTPSEKNQKSSVAQNRWWTASRPKDARKLTVQTQATGSRKKPAMFFKKVTRTLKGERSMRESLALGA
jgi:hypothetical protein